MADQDKAAFELFYSVVDIAEIADRDKAVIPAGDRDVIAVLRPLRAYLDTDEAAGRVRARQNGHS